MASLRRKERSPFWFACFILPDGRRVQRSTKETRRKVAQTMADEWEVLAKQKAKAKQAHQVISDIYKSAHGEDLPSSTTRTFLEGWLARRKGEVKPASYSNYSARVRDFLRWLGKGGDDAIGQLAQSSFVKYRDDVAQRLSVTTANQAVKLLRSMFEDARRDGYLPENPVRDVRPLKSAEERVKRRPFTISELQAVLSVADDEWRSMVLFGIYTGQRIADLARLRWANLDLLQGEIRLQTAKTGRVVIIPLAEPLQRHIASLTAGEADAFIHPRAASHVKVATGQAAALSRQFGDILAAAGLRQVTSHEAQKQGRSGRHEIAPLSFHSLRHTATSLMKNAGVSPAIVQDIIGHDSAEISAHYTHVDSPSKRKALSSLPDLNP
ncbi:site-specific integrase [Verrucomicrobium sp. BvORR034]|uniref:tyrosine-type recombinase/integrase n=1 Tax=Verrucomicrobium sp. BvORR034 TaxID=1396418 RepID=UPI002240EE14|nr:site-specific integrase [Verrucomicrobium sp. BvORR034]